MIDLAIEEAAELGFSIDEFTSIVTPGCGEKAVLRQVKLAFIESQPGTAGFLQQAAAPGVGVTIIPVILDDLIANSEQVNRLLDEVDLVVTTVTMWSRSLNCLPAKETGGGSLGTRGQHHRPRGPEHPGEKGLYWCVLPISLPIVSGFIWASAVSMPQAFPTPLPGTGRN